MPRQGDLPSLSFCHFHFTFILEIAQTYLHVTRCIDVMLKYL